MPHSITEFKKKLNRLYSHKVCFYSCRLQGSPQGSSTGCPWPHLLVGQIPCVCKETGVASDARTKALAVGHAVRPYTSAGTQLERYQ